MSSRLECRYYGRDFTEDEMAVLRALIAGPPALNRSRIATEFCRRIGWTKPDGGLKSMMAKLNMLRMHRDGRIVLPPPLHRKTPLARPITFTQATDPTLFAPPNSIEALRPLRFVTVTGAGAAASRLWNEYIARYHYLGYKRLVGAQMRYAVEDDRTGLPLAMLGFSTAAWKIAPRDNFIGWTPQTRENNLPLVVNHSRFLNPALGQRPEPGIPYPLHRPPPLARGLAPPVRNRPRPDQNLR